MKKVRTFLNWFFAVGGALVTVWTIHEHIWIAAILNGCASAINFSNIVWDFKNPSK